MNSNAVVEMTLPTGTVITVGGLPVLLTQPAAIELMEGNAEILKAELAKRESADQLAALCPAPPEDRK